MRVVNSSEKVRNNELVLDILYGHCLDEDGVDVKFNLCGEDNFPFTCLGHHSHPGRGPKGVHAQDHCLHEGGLTCQC